MIKNYTLSDGKIQECAEKEAQILVCISPDEAERKSLIAQYALDEHTLHSCLDPDELSRLEFEPDHTALIYKRPKKYSAEDNFLFRVMSVGLFLFRADKIPSVGVVIPPSPPFISHQQLIHSPPYPLSYHSKGPFFMQFNLFEKENAHEK